MIKQTQQHLDAGVAARIIGQYSDRFLFSSAKAEGLRHCLSQSIAVVRLNTLLVATDHAIEPVHQSIYRSIQIMVGALYTQLVALHPQIAHYTLPFLLFLLLFHRK
ncbi:hypothetical protein D3C72_1754400 [compost metagenome]